MLKLILQSLLAVEKVMRNAYLNRLVGLFFSLSSSYRLQNIHVILNNFERVSLSSLTNCKSTKNKYDDQQ